MIWYLDAVMRAIAIVILIFGVSLVIYVKAREVIYKNLSMNYLVIKKEKMQELTGKYGGSIVGKCFELASKEHPGIVYDNLPENEKELRGCFRDLFNDLIEDDNF